MIVEESVLPLRPRVNNLEPGPNRQLANKKLIIMMGPPGSGKTTTAHRIRAAILGTMVVSRDYFRLPYKGECALEKYSNTEADELDKKFYNYASEQLSLDYSTVILDATFRERAKRKVALEFAKAHGGVPMIIECVCGYETLVERLTRQQQTGEKCFIKPPEDVVEYYLNNIQELNGELEFASYLQLDTEKNKMLSKSIFQDYKGHAKMITSILDEPFDPASIVTKCNIRLTEVPSIQDYSVEYLSQSLSIP